MAVIKYIEQKARYQRKGKLAAEKQYYAEFEFNVLKKPDHDKLSRYKNRLK